MSLFRKALCKLGTHPHVDFVGGVPGYLQCRDCKRIQKFGVPKRWDDPYPWVDADKWEPEPEWFGYEAWQREKEQHDEPDTAA